MARKKEGKARRADVAVLDEAQLAARKKTGPKLMLRYLGTHPLNTGLHQVALMAGERSIVFTVQDGPVPSVMREVASIVNQFLHQATIPGPQSEPVQDSPEKREKQE